MISKNNQSMKYDQKTHYLEYILKFTVPDDDETRRAYFKVEVGDVHDLSCHPHFTEVAENAPIPRNSKITGYSVSCLTVNSDRSPLTVKEKFLVQQAERCDQYPEHVFCLNK